MSFPTVPAPLVLLLLKCPLRPLLLLLTHMVLLPSCTALLAQVLLPMPLEPCSACMQGMLAWPAAVEVSTVAVAAGPWLPRVKSLTDCGDCGRPCCCCCGCCWCWCGLQPIVLPPRTLLLLQL